LTSLFFIYNINYITNTMATIKIANPNSTTATSGITSSNVSSSLSGNMRLIQSQIKNKNVDYINVKNAVKLLEKYSNWNGYIKLYTEVQNNFEVDDIIYITYLSDIVPSAENLIFNLENPSYPDEGGDRFYLGYKILYVNSFKNEIVINRHFNDIGVGFNLSNQYLSKVSCRGGDLFDDVSDGVVFYNCNILNSNFGTMIGVVSDTTAISGATILCSGLRAISDINGRYSLNIPVGNSIVKCSAPGYITKTFTSTITEFHKITQDILMTPGENSITILSDKTETCEYDFIQFSADTIGYDEPVKFQWSLKRNDTTINIGSDNFKLAYSGFKTGDIVNCTVTDDITLSISNDIEIFIIPQSKYISSTTIDITYGETKTINAYAYCCPNPTFEWKVNNIIVGNYPFYTSSKLENNDIITCNILGEIKSLTAHVTYPSILLLYDEYAPGTACFFGVQKVYYINGNSFNEATKIFKDSIGTPADAGNYSDSINYRTWNPTLNILYPTNSCSTKLCVYTGGWAQYDINDDPCTLDYSATYNFYTISPVVNNVILYTNSDRTTTYNGNNKWIGVKLNNSGNITSLKVDTNGIILDTHICN